MININEYLINKTTKEKANKLKPNDHVLLVDLSYSEAYISDQLIENVYDNGDTISLMKYIGERKYNKKHLNIDEMQPDYVYIDNKSTELIFVGQNAIDILQRQIDHPNSKFYGGKPLYSADLTVKEYCEGLIICFR